MIAEIIIAILSFLQQYGTAVIILGGLFSFLIYLFGKLITDEMPPSSPSSKEAEFLAGVGFFVRLFYTPVVAVLMVWVILTIFKIIEYFSGISWQSITAIYSENWIMFDFVILATQSFFLQFIDKELKNYTARLDFFDKHEEHSKKKMFRVWGYLLAPLSFALLILLIYAHAYRTVGILDMASIIANGMVVMLIFLSTALIHGQWIPKPKIFVYTDFEKKPIEAFFIRLENDCIRVVPRDSSSLLIPKSKIVKIVYPKRESEQPKEQLGFIARIKKASECVQKCLFEQG